MLDRIHSTQQVADLLNAVVLAAEDVEQTVRLDVLRTISRFEQFGWHPGVLEQAIQETAPDVQFADGKVSYDGTHAEALEKISGILARYIELYGYDERANQKLYTMQIAADYLGISRSMMETYVSRRGEIDGEKIGRSWVFTQEALDEFKKNKRSRGRPPATSQ